MTKETEHPAIQANINSISLASAGKKEEWLALYADDAVLKDPVGVSPLDPTGNGHIGKAAIEQFWDTVIGPSNITITAQKRISSGERNCSVLQQAVNDLGNGKTTIVDMIATYEVNDEGKIIEMCAYWNFDELVSQM